VREAAWYDRTADGGVACRLCSHRCAIRPGARGICGVRENVNGTLVTHAYGTLVARAVDPIEKKPLYHFLPGSRAYSIATVGCNFRCDFCQNWQISQARPDEVERAVAVSPELVVDEAERTGCESVAYTYTEPTVFFEFARDTATIARERGVANVFVTNGYQTPETVEAMAGLIDAANVDVKSFSDEFYRMHCKARLAPVLESIRLMRAAGIHVEVTTLVIPGQNDRDGELRGIAEFIAGISTDMVWHVSRFHPEYRAMSVESTPGETLARALEIGRAAGLRYVFVGNASLGSSDTVCPACASVLVTRHGYRTSVLNLKACASGVSGGLTGATCGSCGAPVAIVVRAR
jgi:pyruvate formate lyase activating enzyme